MSSLARSGRVFGYVTALLVSVFLIRLASQSVKVGGNAQTPMWPGALVPLDVTFTNGYDFPVSVTNLKVTVLGVQAPHADRTNVCTVTDFVVDQVSPPLDIVVGARTTRSLSSLHVAPGRWPHVHLLARSANRDACQGASLTLGYTVSRTWHIL